MPLKKSWKDHIEEIHLERIIEVQKPKKPRRLKNDAYYDFRRDLFQGKKCEQCGSTKYLHYQHKKGTIKNFKIMDMRHLPWNRILKEIEKCIVLCNAHHIVYHKKEWDNSS